MYVILGATGHTGSVAAEKLLARGEKVRAVARHKEKLARLASLGAETFEADVTDTPAPTKAFEGGRAAYTLIPPKVDASDFRAYQDKVVDSIATAVENARVPYEVTLSSVGADKDSKTGPVVGLHYFETRLNAVPKLNALHLRAGYFMENTLPQIDIIKSFGMMAGPVRADLPLPMIATRDIGAAAADSLLKLDFSGKRTQELLGQRDITYTETAKIIGAAIGKPKLAYVQLPYDQVIQAMIQMGMSKNLATLICEMAEALNTGHMRPLEPRSPANTTSTSFEQFVEGVFLPAYQGKAATA
jgi:uncharacterized protein YbjT (DUF2867 family)